MPIIVTPVEVPVLPDDPSSALFVGLECTFTYNGVTLNDLSGDDKYRITQIGGLHTADIRDSREVFPGRDGEIPYTSLYGGRTITFQGRIECHHNHLKGLRLMEQALTKAVAPLQESTLYIDCGSLGGFDTQIDCRQSQPLALTEEIKSYNQYRDFMLTLRASDPVIKSQYVQADTFTASGATVATLVFSQENLGNYNAYPTIELTGPLTDPIVSIGGRTLQFLTGTSIPGGQVWTVDTRTMTVLDLAGNSQSGNLSLASSTSIYLQSEVSTPVTFSASGMTAGTSEMTSSFRHSWL